MFRMLIDTCVWLDLAKDPKQHPVLGVVEQMVREKLITLMSCGEIASESRKTARKVCPPISGW
jgi:hypothetical protein